jgi:hypothetical protein
MQGLAVGIGARGRCWGLLPHARAADVPEVRSSRCLSGSAGADPRRAATGLPAPPSYRRGGDALVPGRERRSEAVPVPALGITHPSRLHPTSVGETGRGCPPTERGDARWGESPAARATGSAPIVPLLDPPSWPCRPPRGPEAPAPHDRGTRATLTRPPHHV